MKYFLSLLLIFIVLLLGDASAEDPEPISLPLNSRSFESVKPVLEVLGLKQVRFIEETQRLEISDHKDRNEQIRFLRHWLAGESSRLLEVIHLKELPADQLAKLLRWNGSSPENNCECHGRLKDPRSLAQRLRSKPDDSLPFSTNTQYIAGGSNRVLLVQGSSNEVARATAFARHLDVDCVQVNLQMAVIRYTPHGNFSNALAWLEAAMEGKSVVVYPTNSPIVSTSNRFSYAAYFETAKWTNMVQGTNAQPKARLLSHPEIIDWHAPEPWPLEVDYALESADYGLNIGLKRVNAFRRDEHYVEIDVSMDYVGGEIVIDGNQVPIITRNDLELKMPFKQGAVLAIGGLRHSLGNEMMEPIFLIRLKVSEQ